MRSDSPKPLICFIDDSTAERELFSDVFGAPEDLLLQQAMVLRRQAADCPEGKLAAQELRALTETVTHPLLGALIRQLKKPM